MSNHNHSELLARFAAVSQRLQGTGAPGVYEWMDIDDPDSPVIYNAIGERWPVLNPQACLAGCVMWAMEVYWWASITQGYVCPPKPNYAGESPAEWMLKVLESIADAIGGG